MLVDPFSRNSQSICYIRVYKSVHKAYTLKD